MWYGFNGVVVTILIALFSSFFCSKSNEMTDKNTSMIESYIRGHLENSQSKIDRIDSSLLISWEDIANEGFCCKKPKSEVESHHLQVDISVDNHIFNLNYFVFQKVMKVDGSIEEKEPMPVSPSNNSVS